MENCTTNACEEKNENKFSETMENLTYKKKQEEEEEITKPETIKTEAKLPETGSTSLALLAEAYGDSDSEVEEASEDASGEKTEEYRQRTEEEEESEEDEESDSVETEATSSSSSESEENDEERTDPSKTVDKGGRRASRDKEVGKGEFDDLPPIEDLQISVPEVLCDPLGEVAWTVEQMVVVKPKTGKPTLNLDTVLFIERGKRVLGRVFDVFGQVSDPHYCVRFNDVEHLKQRDVKIGMTVYFCPNTEYTSVVFLNDLLKMKASEEIGDEENPEFSDDEEERAYYASLKQRQKNEKIKNTEIPQKRQRSEGQDFSWKSSHPWNTGRRQQNVVKKGGKNNNYKNEARSSNSWQHPVNSQQTWAFNNQFNIDSRPEGANFYRPVETFPADNFYFQNRSFRPPRFPFPNYSWQSSTPPRPPNFYWSLPPPPPPPPGN